MAKKSSETPLMKQYNEIKAKHPDALLLFRVGDFYETFGSDAITASQILGIVLTKRKNGSASSVELAGFPHHALDTYLPKLVKAGKRVAICDQLEDPKLTKSIVKRGITELVTPGVALNANLLENKENNFLASVYKDKNLWGVAFLDISTGEFLISQGSGLYIDKLIQSLKPAEMLYLRNQKKEVEAQFGTDFYYFPLEDWAFEEKFAREKLQSHFKTKSLKGFGVEDLNAGIASAGSIMQYLNQTRHDQLEHITSISRLDQNTHVWLDRFTIRNLELFSSYDGGGNSLLNTLDHTISPMGARMLKRWLGMPLKAIKAIQHRQDLVERFTTKDKVRNAICEELSQISDLERILSRLSSGKTSPKEIRSLANSLDAVANIKTQLKISKIKSFVLLSDEINPCDAIRKKIENELNDDPPVQIIKGNVIREGVSPELDELRELLNNGKSYLDKLQKRESEKTGIQSLKIGYNNVFGYYLEVTNTHKPKVPEEWQRKQTLVNSERYITEELKNYEEKILSAEESILKLESDLFNDLLFDISKFVEAIQSNANVIAKIDCLICFADLAIKNNYTKPKLSESKKLEILQGRHPVIEQMLPPEEPYISNDIYLDNEQQQILMITGPNMSGKSALLRQTALIVLMAQMGSFVPAKAASIGIVDKIFTRVGASDNISRGESTFMVEMNETASILNNLSENSLVLLDEIGRGTSTYDGISIAWAIAEYLHRHSSQPKTLFATHYHELNEMADHFDRIKNFNVSIKEINGDIVFLRKLEAGGSAHSFGIHVAKLAGMPKSLLSRAEQVLKSLEKDHLNDESKNGIDVSKDMQLSIFQLDDPTLSQVKDEILRTDIDTLTPVEALLKLHEIKKLIS